MIPWVKLGMISIFSFSARNSISPGSMFKMWSNLLQVKIF